MKSLRSGKNNNSPEKTRGELKSILLDEIKEISNVRTEYTEENIKELAGSIEREGLLQPILVIEHGEEDGRRVYRVIEGHRRLRAFQYLRSQDKPTFNQIQALVKKTLNDIETVQLIANIQREDLSSGDLEKAVKSIMKREELKQDEIAKRLGKSKAWVSQIIGAEKIREKYKSFAGETSQEIEEIPSTVLYEFSGIKDQEIRNKAIERAIKKGATKRTAREEANKIKNQNKNTEKPKKLNKPGSKEKVKVSHHSMVNSYYDTVEKMEPYQIQHFLIKVLEESLIKLKGDDRQRSIDDIKKILKRYKGV